MSKNLIKIRDIEKDEDFMMVRSVYEGNPLYKDDENLEVVEDVSDVIGEPVGGIKPVEDMNLTQLREMAKKKQIPGYTTMDKDELLAAIAKED